VPALVMKDQFNYIEFCKNDEDELSRRSRRRWRDDVSDADDDDSSSEVLERFGHSYSWWDELSEEEKEEEKIFEQEELLVWEEANRVASDERLRRWIYGGLSPPAPLAPAHAPPPVVASVPLPPATDAATGSAAGAATGAATASHSHDMWLRN